MDLLTYLLTTRPVIAQSHSVTSHYYDNSVTQTCMLTYVRTYVLLYERVRLRQCVRLSMNSHRRPCIAGAILRQLIADRHEPLDFRFDAWRHCPCWQRLRSLVGACDSHLASLSWMSAMLRGRRRVCTAFIVIKQVVHRRLATQPTRFQRGFLSCEIRNLTVCVLHYSHTYATTNTI